MISGLGVLGYGVGGIEAEAVLLGQPLYQPCRASWACASRRAAARLHGHRPGARRQPAAAGARRGRRVRGVRRRRPGRPGAGRPGHDRQHGARVRRDRHALPHRRGDARLPAPDRSTGRPGRPRGGATRRSRACGACRAPDPCSTRPWSSTSPPSRPAVAGPRRPQDRVALADLGTSFRASSPTAWRRRPTPGRPRPASPTRAAPPTPATSRPTRRRPPRTSRPGRPSRRWSWTRGAIARSPSRSTGSASRWATGRWPSPPSPAARTPPTRPSWSGAGLLARNAVARGLSVAPTVKTSLAPGSRAVTGYLDEAGLLAPLETLGFDVVGYGCTTCIGNSGPLDEAVARGRRGERPGGGRGPVRQPQLRGTHPSPGPRQLPRLAAARGGLRPGRPRRHRPDARSRWGPMVTAAPSSWPTSGRARRRSGPPSARPSRRSCSATPTPASSTATSAGAPCPCPTATATPGIAASTYIARPPFFAGLDARAGGPRGHHRRPRPGRAGRLGDDRPHLARPAPSRRGARPASGSRRTACPRSSSTATAPAAATTRS